MTVSNFSVGNNIPCIQDCTDPTAENYNFEATFDDGSCDYLGCTNPDANNFNPQATINDGTCTILICDEEYHFSDYWGPVEVYFEKENNADWNDPTVRDQITPTCEITRQNQQPLYNYVTQINYYDNQYNSNIEWKQGTYDQAGAWYESLGNAFGNYMQGVVGQTATLHIIDSDLYFEFEFHTWTSNGNGGGYSYTRTWSYPGGL